MDTIYMRLHVPVTSLKISELPPAIKTGRVLAKIEAAGINPSSDVASVQDRFPGSVLPRMVARDLAVSVVDGTAEGFGAEVGEPLAILAFRMMEPAANTSQYLGFSSHWPA